MVLVHAPELAIDPAISKCAVDRVRLAQCRLRRTRLAELQPSASRCCRLVCKPSLEGFGVREGEERKIGRRQANSN
jgi:hypothetical protein